MSDTLTEIQEAKRLAKFWESEAALNHQIAQFYRGIVMATGELLGPECKRSDDGSMQSEPLALKVTELVADALREAQAQRVRIADLELVIASANNSLHGSEGTFLNLNGSDVPDKFHLSGPIEDLKRDAKQVQALREQACETCVHFCRVIHNMNECLHPNMVPMVPAVIDGKPFGCPGHKRKESSR